MTKVLIDIDDSLLMGALAESQEQQMSLDDFIGQALRQTLTDGVEVTVPTDIDAVLEDAVQKAQELPNGERFHLTDLIGGDRWQAIGTGERRALGKSFRARMEQSIPPVARHIGRTSANLAIYERI